MSAKRITSYFNHLLREWNVTHLRGSMNPATCEFTIPGLSLENYDRYGNPCIRTITKMAVNGRVFAYHMPHNPAGDTFLDWDKVTTDRTVFLACTEIRLSRAMYDPSVSKSPLHVKCRLRTLGNSTQGTVTEIFSPDDDEEPLYTKLFQVVTVSKDTRKPLPLPGWFKEKYAGQAIEKDPLIIRTFDRPDNTFVLEMTSTWSDTDHINHTTFTSYLRYATDALHYLLARAEQANAAANCGNLIPRELNLDSDREIPSVLRGMTMENFERGVKLIRVTCPRESYEGHRLKVHIWQQEGEERVVRCAIERDNLTVCQILMEFY